MKTTINLISDGYSYMVADEIPKVGQPFIDIHNKILMVRTQPPKETPEYISAIRFYSRPLEWGMLEKNSKVIIASNNPALADILLWLEVPVNGIDVEALIRQYSDKLIITARDFYKGQYAGHAQTSKEIGWEVNGYENGINAILELTKHKRWTDTDIQNAINIGEDRGIMVILILKSYPLSHQRLLNAKWRKYFLKT